MLHCCSRIRALSGILKQNDPKALWSAMHDTTYTCQGRVEKNCMGVSGASGTWMSILESAWLVGAMMGKACVCHSLLWGRDIFVRTASSGEDKRADNQIIQKGSFHVHDYFPLFLFFFLSFCFAIPFQGHPLPPLALVNHVSYIPSSSNNTRLSTLLPFSPLLFFLQDRKSVV